MGKFCRNDELDFVSKYNVRDGKISLFHDFMAGSIKKISETLHLE